MFKVLIIDDEPIIRKGLRNIINWKNFECEVCGEASDGLKGIELINELHPEIIITDVRMPAMDGLTMIKEVKEALPGTKIIILTGYRDFDYAQDALKLGAFDYLLKPTKIDQLNSVIGKAVNDLKRQKSCNDELLKYKKLFEQNMPLLREKLLYDIINGIISDENDIMGKMKLLELSVDRFIFVLVEEDSSEDGEKDISQYEKHLYQYGIANTFEEVFSDCFKVTSISLDNRRIAFVLQPLSFQEDMMKIVDRKGTYLQEIIMNCFGFTITAAVSSEGNGILELPVKFEECREALYHKLYLGGNSIIFYSDLKVFFKYRDLSSLEKLRLALLESVKTGNEKLVRSKLADIGDYVKNLGQDEHGYVKSFLLSIITSINGIRLSLQSADGSRINEGKDMTGLYQLADKCQDVLELYGLLENIAVALSLIINNYNSRSMKLVLKKAVEYINSHFSQQINLNEVAEHTYVSTYYISRLFKRETGKNFVDYITELRIEKAKELLKEGRYKTYEIAEMVGIPDSHYFSRLFKKYAGLTPTEYKDSAGT